MGHILKKKSKLLLTYLEVISCQILSALGQLEKSLIP